MDSTWDVIVQRSFPHHESTCENYTTNTINNSFYDSTSPLRLTSHEKHSINITCPQHWQLPKKADDEDPLDWATGTRRLAILAVAANHCPCFAWFARPAPPLPPLLLPPSTAASPGPPGALLLLLLLHLHLHRHLPILRRPLAQHPRQTQEIRPAPP